MAGNSSERPLVLVIEDDPALQHMLIDMLTDEGYRVVATGLGGEGLMLIETAAPQLITLDLRLPDVHGERVLEILQRHHASRPLPVIVISAMRSIPARVRDLAQAVIPKPFVLDELLDIIRAALPHAGAELPPSTEPRQ